jgi:excisionase family DNA binding protein
MSSLPQTESEASAASHSTATVARRLGVSIPTVQRWVDQGHLKAWKTVGGHRRIDAASVDLFIQRREPQDLAGSLIQDASIAPFVLIVDDNPVDRELLVGLVEEALPAAAITAVGSGFECLIAVGQRTPDVLITDIMMPHMNGFEMLRHVATRCAVRPKVVIAVSGRSPEQFAELGELPDDVQFLAKPLNADVLIDLLRACADASGLRAVARA